MEPKEFDFEFPRGDTAPLTLELLDGEGNQLDITPENCEITFTVRDSSKNIVMQKTYSNKDIEVSGTKATLVIEHNDTKDLKINGTYSYDVQFTSGDYYKTLVIGKFKLTNEITY